MLETKPPMLAMALPRKPPMADGIWPKKLLMAVRKLEPACCACCQMLDAHWPMPPMVWLNQLWMESQMPLSQLPTLVVMPSHHGRMVSFRRPSSHSLSGSRIKASIRPLSAVPRMVSRPGMLSVNVWKTCDRSPLAASPSGGPHVSMTSSRTGRISAISSGSESERLSNTVCTTGRTFSSAVLIDPTRSVVAVSTAS